jgi:nucleotide-binding universal stress UspA family protein
MAVGAGVADARAMHFLCGIDRSARAPAVAYAAAHVARRMGAALTLAHVAPTRDWDLSAPRALGEAALDLRRLGAPAQAAARGLEALADDIAAAFGTRPDVRVVADDDPAAGLARTAQALAADLVVVGSTSRGRVANPLRPGMPDALVERVARPVMVVPPGALSPTANGVAVAYDTSPASGGAAAVAAQLASELDDRLTVIHVLPDPRSYTRSVLAMHRYARGLVEDTLSGEELDLRHVSAYRLPTGDLAQTVGEVQPSLLAVAAPARASRRSLLRPSLAARLIRSAACPVVLVPEGAAIASDRTAKVMASA